MNLFDKLKKKSLEKILEQAASRPETQDMLKSMGASQTEMAGVIQALKGMNLSSLMGMLKAFKPGEPVTPEKIRAVFDPAMIQQLASKLHVSPEKAPEKIAEMMNLMSAQRPSSA